MIWDIPTIVNLIESGVMLIPKFIELWKNARDSFSSSDAAVIDAALRAAIAQDAADTAAALAELDAAAQRT